MEHIPYPKLAYFVGPSENIARYDNGMYNVQGVVKAQTNATKVRTDLHEAPKEPPTPKTTHRQRCKVTTVTGMTNDHTTRAPRMFNERKVNTEEELPIKPAE